MPSPANAGTCSNTAESSSVWVCRGAAGQDASGNARADINISVPVNDSLTLTDEDGFGLNVASGDAFTILGTPSSTFMTINLGGNISADREAFDISHQGTGDISLTTSGSVTSDTEEAFSVVHSGAGDVIITTGGTVTASQVAARSGIVVNQSGSGNIALNINSSIVGGSSASAIALSTASGNATITLGADASFTRGIHVSGVAGAASIEIGGTGDRSFDISDIPAITGDINFDKNDDETLTVTGTHASGAAFASTNVNAGELVWGGAAFRTTNLAVANGATLGITGNSSFGGASVTLSGRLELIGNSASFAVGTLAGDGDIDIDVDFSGGDTELSTARLTATSVAETTLVNIRAIGGFPEIDESDEDGAITLENFIVADDQAFEAGDALDNGNFHFDLVYDTGESRWNLIARPGRTRGAVPGSIEEALFESFPATLARFAGLESFQQRARGKAATSNIKGAGAWGKASRSSRKVEPNSTALATFDIDNTAVQFGVDIPLHNAFTFGASVGFGDITTDVAVPGTRADIDTNAITAGISANWKRDRIYIDTQIQYTTFDNTFKLQDAQGTQIASPDADAIAAGIELGYVIDLGDLSDGALGGLGGIGDITLTPFAQLAWTSVDFDDLAGTATPVSLDDGDVLFGRIGAAAAGKYLYGSASLQIPLDGETGVKVDGAAFTSEIEDVAFDVGVGFAYPLTENGITLDGAVETTQGGEAEAYNANLAVRFNF